MKICGIYKIVNDKTNKYYVGSSKNILHGCSGRWQKHKRRLIQNSHPNLHLQNAWNKQNGIGFRVIVVEECCEKDLFECEQKYLNIAKTEKEHCYNKSFIAGAIDMTPEVKEKIRNYRKGKKHSKETRIKMSLRKIGSIPPNKGIPMTEERKNKNSKYWSFISPTNEIIHIRNLNKFCKKNKLHCGHMQEVFVGKHNHHKGWKRYDSGL